MSSGRCRVARYRLPITRRATGNGKRETGNDSTRSTLHFSDTLSGVNASGLQLFARYAYPPNQRGYCGPDEARTLIEYAAAGITDPGLAMLARAFHGPLPYLTVMAQATGIHDPFDRRLVEAYWVGNPLLERVDVAAFARVLDDAFRRRMGGGWGFFEEAIPAGGVPHHSFHVFAVYPWVGMLRGERTEPLEILDRCRIRWGTVMTVTGETAVVSSQPLQWDGRSLSLGPERPETVNLGADGLRLAGEIALGDVVSMHWDWVCDRLDRTGLRHLGTYTRRHLEMVNTRLAHSGPAVVLD